MADIFPSPFGANSLQEPQMFEQRLLYKQKSFSRLFDITPLDLIYEKPYYGKINIYGTPIYPSEADMVQLPGPGLIVVHDFVAAAFKDFKRYMERAMLSNEKLFGDLFSSFTPKSATINIHQAYQDHFIENVFGTFANEYINASKVNKRIKNFDDLVKEFLHYAVLISENFPVTKTGFILSPMCTNAISGLFIELETLPHDSDSVKYGRFLSRPSFDRYMAAADGFGFYIDKNAPWRIATNMDSPVTEKYMNKFGIKVEDNSVFSSYFYESEYFSYESIKGRLWNLYATLLGSPNSKTYGTEYTVNNCTKASWRSVGENRYETNMSIGLREAIPLHFDKEDLANADLPPGEPPPITFKEKYTDEYFLPIYLKLRLIESNIKYKHRDMKAAMRTILNLHNVYSVKAAVAHIGHLTNQTHIYKESTSAPYKINYFGDSISSGLYSYLESDILQKAEIKKYTSTEY